MEAVGIVVVPGALVVGHLMQSMYSELVVLGVGAAIFWAGHLIAGRAS